MIDREDIGADQGRQDLRVDRPTLSAKCGPPAARAMRCGEAPALKPQATIKCAGLMRLWRLTCSFGIGRIFGPAGLQNGRNVAQCAIQGAEVSVVGLGDRDGLSVSRWAKPSPAADQSSDWLLLKIVAAFANPASRFLCRFLNDNTTQSGGGRSRRRQLYRCPRTRSRGHSPSRAKWSRARSIADRAASFAAAPAIAG